MDSPTIHMEPDDNRGPALLTIYVVQCSLALAFLALRLWARISIHTLGWDDFFMVITWVVHAVATIFVGIVSTHGGYRHSYHLEPEQLRFLARINTISQFPGIVSPATGKAAICLLFMRVFGTISTWRKAFIWALMTVNIIDCIICLVVVYARCASPEALWDPATRTSARCWDPGLYNTIMVTLQSLNCCFDFVLAAVPITFIWGLRFSLLKRIGLILSLGGGFFSGICAAFKVKALSMLIQRSEFPSVSFGLYAWTSSEISVIILCGCIPTLMPLWDRFERNLRSFIAKSQPSSFREPRERRRRPTCRVRRASSIELSRSNARSDTVVSSLGAKAFDDDSHGSQSTFLKTTRSFISRHDEGTSIQVTKSFHVDYSVPHEV
ncbi:hypothetical protein GGR53DRAFT_16490 [Hypoxylon sp. FL1150]|nr:hypothetical protein GGR53DRAFT_16490 [Hypoxylon sp. FL1150]